MGPIGRNIVLAALICTFCQFGALAAKDPVHALTCYGIALATVVLVFMRCAHISRKNAERRQQERMFNEYMRMQGTRGFRGRR